MSIGDAFKEIGKAVLLGPIGYAASKLIGGESPKEALKAGLMGPIGYSIFKGDDGDKKLGDAAKEGGKLALFGPAGYLVLKATEDAKAAEEKQEGKQFSREA